MNSAGLHEYFVWAQFEWDVTEAWRIAERKGAPEVVPSRELEPGLWLIRFDNDYAMSDAIDLSRLDVLLGQYMPSAGKNKRSMDDWGHVYGIILDGHHKLLRAVSEGLLVNVYRLSFEETLSVQIQGPKPTKAQVLATRHHQQPAVG